MISHKTTMTNLDIEITNGLELKIKFCIEEVKNNFSQFIFSLLWWKQC